MDEYIEREALERSLNERLNRLFKLHGRHDHYVQGFDDCVGRVEEFPAADVTPVRHGRWDDDHKCTVCHNEAFCKISNIRPNYDYDWEENLVETGDYIWDIEWIETAYCPNCGAKMDGVDDE